MMGWWSSRRWAAQWAINLSPPNYPLSPQYTYEKTLLALTSLRLEYKLKKYKDLQQDQKLKEKILVLKADLRSQAEQEIVARLESIRRYLRNPERDPHLSMEEIFKARPKNGLLFKGTLRELFKGKKRHHQEADEAHA